MILSFPANPAHGTIFELEPGLLYQFDSAVNAWVEIVSSDVVLPTATTIKPGAMSSIDFKKLNRLVLPPPRSTIIGTDCAAPFRSGVLTLSSGDKFVNVQGNLELRNIDETGEVISEEFPFGIHQHTFGFDFTLDVPALITELIKRGQLNILGATGDVGPTGDVGDKGADQVFSGPKGEEGDQGLAPPCNLSLEPEPIQTQIRPGLKKALAAVRTIDDPTDSTKYSLEFDRQDLGAENVAASKFVVRQQRSTWVLAVTSVVGTPQPIYYIDVEPLLDAVRSKYLQEVDRLKKGYDDIVQFWVQTMSDLFDEQKTALCCALEFCKSKTKNAGLREHMEDVAAASVGQARIVLNNRDSSEAVELSSTRMLADLPDGEDLCENGPVFPQPPFGTTRPPGFEAAKASVIAEPQIVESARVMIDPLINAGISNGVPVELKAGTYTAIIERATAQINGLHYAPISIQYAVGGKSKVTKFMDKGRFQSLMDGVAAYEGLTTSFTHDGGTIRLFFNILPTPNTAGEIVISLTGTDVVNVAKEVQPITPEPVKKRKRTAAKVESVTCHMPYNKLAWYQRGWETGNCCGCIVNVGGQDYIIVKRSLGEDQMCGGGENIGTPCIANFIEDHGHPAFAWPTLDGRTFAPIPADGVTYRYDQSLNDLVSARITNEEHRAPAGRPNGVRHLSYQLMTVLFPVF